MRTYRSPLAAAAALTLALGLAGCAGGDGSSNGESAQIDAAPAAGATVSGDAYSYSIPEGWEELDASAAPGADSVAADMEDTDGFADNVNVVLSPAGEVTNDQVESDGVDELENGGATDVVINDRLTVAGGESSHLTAALESAGTTYKFEQYYLTNEGQTYVVTFSFSDTVSDADRVETAESVLASWSWS